MATSSGYGNAGDESPALIEWLEETDQYILASEIICEVECIAERFCRQWLTENMPMEAQSLISSLSKEFFDGKSDDDAYTAIDNEVLHDLLNNNAVHVREVSDQETWVMSDGSYITRLEDKYWVGNDIDIFEDEMADQSPPQNDCMIP